MAITTTPDRTPEGWGGVADAYDEHVAPMSAQFARQALDAIDVRPGQDLLDVAAGTGALSLEAARRKARVLATDFSPEMVQRLQARARQESLHLEARVMDGQALEIVDGSFDAACCNLGLMFFPDPDKGMAEMHRVLRPGGQVAAVVVGQPERIEMFSTMFAALDEAAPDLPPLPQPPAVFSLSDPEDLARRMEQAGFQDVAVDQITATFAEPSPEAAWEAMIQSNPVMPGLLARVGPDVEAVRKAYIRRAADRMRDGRIVLRNEAHLATGTA